MPIAKPDPVSASTSSGNAVKLTASPSDEIPWLTSRTLKSRFWARGDVDRLRRAAGRPALRASADGTEGGREAVARRRRDHDRGGAARRIRAWTAVADATDRLIRAGRRLGARGLISAGEGNISVRLDADRLLVTPAGLRKDELAPDDLVVVWLDHPDREARLAQRPRADLGPGDPPRRPRGPSRYRRGRPRPPPGGDGSDPRRRGPRSGSPARDGAAAAAPAVPVARDPRAAPNWPAGSRRRCPSPATARAAAPRGPARAPRRGRGRRAIPTMPSTGSSSSRSSAGHGAMRC